MSSPYRIPDPPRRSEPELDVSPAVVVLAVAALVAAVLLSHERPATRPAPYGFLPLVPHAGAPAPARPRGGR